MNIWICQLNTHIEEHEASSVTRPTNTVNCSSLRLFCIHYLFMNRFIFALFKKMYFEQFVKVVKLLFTFEDILSTGTYWSFLLLFMTIHSMFFFWSCTIDCWNWIKKNTSRLSVYVSAESNLGTKQPVIGYKKNEIPCLTDHSGGTGHCVLVSEMCLTFIVASALSFARPRAELLLVLFLYLL